VKEERKHMYVKGNKSIAICSHESWYPTNKTEFTLFDYDLVSSVSQHQVGKIY